MLDKAYAGMVYCIMGFFEGGRMYDMTRIFGASGFRCEKAARQAIGSQRAFVLGRDDDYEVYLRKCSTIAEEVCGDWMIVMDLEWKRKIPFDKYGQTVAIPFEEFGNALPPIPKMYQDVDPEVEGDRLPP